MATPQKILLVAALGMLCNPLLAEVTAEQAAALGDSLTPLGAEPGANTDGSISAWQGAALFGESAKQAMPDPDQQLRQLDSLIAWPEPTYVITRDNRDQYRDVLSAGHYALFDTRPDFRMPVYPNRRGAFYPEAYYAATKRNATQARLEGTDVVTGAVLGIPFPVPGSGAEVIWNHKTRYRGDALVRSNNEAIVYDDGRIEMTKKLEDVNFDYGNMANPGNLEQGSIASFLGRIVAPARVAGQLVVVHEKAGIGSSGRMAWIFNPGMNRVNRAPQVGYDAPSPGTDNQQINDQIDVFNGALDRYDWTLLGKRELLIPYNSTRINSHQLAYADMLQTGHLNPDVLRYEKHRVWVVEARLRDGVRHQFQRRTFYVDEDSWQIAVVDCYDARGELWKLQEAHTVTIPWVPITFAMPDVIYDLKSDRYFATTLHNEDTFPDFTASFREGYFSPNNLKRLARK